MPESEYVQNRISSSSFQIFLGRFILIGRGGIAETESPFSFSYLVRNFDLGLIWNVGLFLFQPRNLLKHQGLRFVTSSLEKKAQLAAAEKEQMPTLEKAQSDVSSEKEQLSSLETVKETEEAEGEKLMNNGYRISASTAYQIAAAAASYLQSHTKSILSFRSAKTSMKEDLVEGGDHSMGDGKIASSEMASFVVTTNSVTAVVAGKEEMKQAVAKDLSSARSSPCEWFICDDDNCGTRFFVIQVKDCSSSELSLFSPLLFHKAV